MRNVFVPRGYLPIVTSTKSLTRLLGRPPAYVRAMAWNFSAACWGPQLSNRGMLTIRQRKMGLMPFIPTPGSSSFIVGTFRARRVGDGDGDAPAAV